MVFITQLYQDSLDAVQLCLERWMEDYKQFSREGVIVLDLIIKLFCIYSHVCYENEQLQDYLG